MSQKKLTAQFYEQDVLILAPLLLGKILVRCLPDGTIIRTEITETEAYNGIEDMACHAHKGQTLRNKIMWEAGGYVYIYLIYGMYYMFNIVTGKAGRPEAILIRGVNSANGPGKLTKQLLISKECNGAYLPSDSKIWIEDAPAANYIAKPRVGIDYAGEYWKNIEWRFIKI